MIAGRCPGARRSGAIGRERAQPAVRAEPDVQQHDVDLRRIEQPGGFGRLERRRHADHLEIRLRIAGSPRSPRPTTGWSSTMPTRISVPAIRAPRACHAGRPAPDIEDRADGLGPLLHVEQAEVAGPVGAFAGVGLDAGTRVVDRQVAPPAVVA